MTVQTQVRPSVESAGTRRIRGIRGWVLGLAVVIAAGTGVGFGIASIAADDTPAIVAPDSPQTEALKRLHSEGFADPLAGDRVEALKRLHAEGAGFSVDSSSFSDAYRQLKDEGWTN